MAHTREQYEEAVVILINELKSQKNMYTTWQANIAMTFKDEYAKKSYGPKNKETIHIIANQAAKNFLDLLITSIK